MPPLIAPRRVYRRVLSALKPQAFHACFANRLKSLREKAAEAAGIEPPHYALDGKTARGSHDKNKGRGRCIR